MDGQGTKCRRSISENFNRLSRVHKRYRQTTDDRQTDGRAIAYSEREPESTFAKNCLTTLHKMCIFNIRGMSHSSVNVLQVLLHDANEQPLMRERGFKVSPGYLTQRVTL